MTKLRAISATPIGVVILLATVTFTYIWVAGLVCASSEAAPFGIERFESGIIEQGGAPAVQAGFHPYAMTTTITFDHHEGKSGSGFPFVPNGDPKAVEVSLPAGLIVNPTTTEVRCTESELENSGACPDAAAVGVAELHVGLDGAEGKAAVYNMVPSQGVPGELAFNGLGLDLIVHIIGKVRSDSDYGISAEVADITQRSALYSTTLTLWGDPSAESHDGERGACAENGGSCPVPRLNRPLLIAPSSCTGETLKATMRADSWQEPEFIEPPVAELPGMTGCDKLELHPTLSVEPTGIEESGGPEAPTAGSPTGLNVDLKVPREESLNGLAEADLREATVTLPAGMSVSPAAAGGLEVCTDTPEPARGEEPERPGGEIELGSMASVKCPDGSKIGTVEVVTPLLEHPLVGSVYVAQQGANPFGSLFALYVVAEGSGVQAKLPGEIKLDEATGQLTARFGKNPITGYYLPQVPFSELKMHIFGGPKAPLVTPQACGAYTANSVLTPYGSETPAEPASLPAEPQSGFAISLDCGGFAPVFTAGTADNQAGGFSPVAVTLSRRDGEQNFGGISVTTPPGLLGMLSKVALCGEPQASQGTCGAESLIGEAAAAAGPGEDPYWVKGGRVYLTGSYNGAPFGLSIVVPTVAGPFTLKGSGGPGTEVVQALIKVNPHTGALTVTGALPSILQGVPLDIQQIYVDINRGGFTFNPTSCDALSVGGTITSTLGAQAYVSNRFQATDCGALAFKPSFSASTQASDRVNGNGASLTVKVTQHTGEAGIRSVHLELPKKLPSRLTTLHKACLEARFDANPAACLAGSIVGTGVVHTPVLPVPLEGPAYLVSHGGAQFPELVFVLQGEGVTIELTGETHISSKTSITSSTFGSVPDAPISSFEANLPEQSNSALALVRGTKLCGGSSLTMPTTITGQNGAQIKQTTKIAVAGCPKKHKKASKAKKKSRRRRGGGKR